MRLRYKDLTPEQNSFICNGCGEKGGWIKPPNFIFKASCNHHDFKYWSGHTIDDFKSANSDFYHWMKIDIESERKLYKRAYYNVWAYSYYKAVSLFGKKYFNFSDRYRTIEDLRSE